MSAAALPLTRSDVDVLRRYRPFDRMEELAVDFLVRCLVPVDYAAGSMIASPRVGAKRRLHIVLRGAVHIEQSGVDEVFEEPNPPLGPGDCSRSAPCSPIRCPHHLPRGRADAVP